MNSYNLECHVSNYFIFNDENILESVFEIFEKNDKEDIKFLIACMFVSLSIMEEIWTKLKNLCMVKVTTLFIHEYIYKTYSTKIIYSKTVRDKRTKLIQFFIKKVLIFFCKSKNFRAIYHIDFYSNYLKIVSLLFYIYDQQSRNEILNIFNVFTYYYDCKNKIIKDPCNKNILPLLFERINFLKEELDKCKTLYLDCKTNLDENMHYKSNNNGYQNPELDENIALFENSKKHIESYFCKTTDDFIYLISIVTNLMMNHDFKASISNVIKEDMIKKIYTYEEFFLDKSLDFIEKKHKNIFLKYILQIRFARYIYKPENIRKENKCNYLIM
jgi:hypothetical protein